MKQLLAITALVIFAPCVAWAGKVQEIKTPQGFTVWLVEEHSLPLISMNISFTRSGLAYDPKGKEGRTNMVSALLQEGAGDRGAKAFTEALEEDAIRLNTGADDDTLHLTLQTLSDRKEQAFSLLSDALLRPRFDDEAVDRLRAKMQVLLIEQSESPFYKLSRAWQVSVFGDHPYARMGIGTKESLSALNKKDFQNYLSRYVTKENMVISVVGDITGDHIAALIDKSFAALPSKYEPDSAVSEITVPSTPEMTSIKHAMPQSMVTFGLAGLKREDPDYIPAFVMNYILGGNGLGSRLSAEIREKRGLAYSVRTQLEPKAHSALWRGSFSTKNEEAKNAITILKETLATFVKQGVTQEELDDAKAYLTGSFVLDLSSNQEVADFLTVMQIFHLGSDYLDKRNQLINNVTLADIQRVSERLIDPAALRMVVVGNQ